MMLSFTRRNTEGFYEDKPVKLYCFVCSRAHHIYKTRVNAKIGTPGIMVLFACLFCIWVFCLFDWLVDLI